MLYTLVFVSPIKYDILFCFSFESVEKKYSLKNDLWDFTLSMIESVKVLMLVGIDWFEQFAESLILLCA